jgi:hypothetical protein
MSHRLTVSSMGVLRMNAALLALKTTMLTSMTKRPF